MTKKGHSEEQILRVAAGRSGREGERELPGVRSERRNLFYVWRKTYSGRPVENGYIESFNGRLRDECLNVKTFVALLY